MTASARTLRHFVRPTMDALVAIAGVAMADRSCQRCSHYSDGSVHNRNGPRPTRGWLMGILRARAPSIGTGFQNVRSDAKGHFSFFERCSNARAAAVGPSLRSTFRTRVSRSRSPSATRNTCQAVFALVGDGSVVEPKGPPGSHFGKALPPIAPRVGIVGMGARL